MSLTAIRIGGCARAPAPRSPRSSVFGACLWLALAASLAPAARAQQGQQIMPNYRDADIRQVIEAVGAVTGRNFNIDPRVRAQVTLLSFSPMSPETFYEAFLSMLQVHGYVALDSEAGDITNIIPDANARQFPSGGPAAAGDIVTQTIPVTNVNAAQLVPILRPLQPQYAHLAAAQGGSNMLIIADRADNVARLVNIIERIDRAADEDIEVIALENAAASEVVRMLGQLTQTAAAAGGGAPTVQLIADERTNSVLLSGSQNNRLRYRALIAHLDTPSEQAGDTRVVYLRYADATDLAENLRTQFTSAAAAEGAPPGQTGEVSIWADEGTNALVINAPARILQDMMSVISQIDIRRLQVQVDAIIVELGEQKAAELGVTWALAGSDSTVGVTNFGIGTGILQLAAPALGDGGQLDPSAVPQGITAGLGDIADSGTSWAAVINALRGDAQTNVLSTPTIVTLDNEEAEIRVGQEVPFVTGQFTNTGAAQGSVNPFTTIQREEVGTLLKITPQINEGSGVRLTIEQNQSSLSSAAGAVDLVTNTRTILTSVFVEDGDILVLGGLLDDKVLENEQRVPVLGKIPGLGWLFRSRSTDRTKVNLTVFIRPTILRDGADARFQTNAKYNYLRGLQQQQSERPVQLMREESYPLLPELPAQQQTAPTVIEPVRPAEPQN
jgi:general secretion pathway protein D